MRRLTLAVSLMAACSGAPAEPPAVAWLDSHGARLAGSDSSHSTEDLAPLGAIVGDARVVAFGEATHGTREFTQLRHRFLEYLVAEKGFTVLALEAIDVECSAISAYVLGGAGDAMSALGNLSFWPLRTEEMRVVVEWLRTRKFRFVCFDSKAELAAGDTFHRFEARDLAMANAVESLLAAYPHEKMIVWAHNVHVQFSHDGARSMGRHLRERLGADYVAFGFLFGHGEFRAVEQTGKQRGPTVHSVGPPPDADVSAPFARTRAPLLLVDLREPHDTWFDAPHPVREAGAIVDEKAPTTLIVLPARFDAVIYVDAMTSSRAIGN